MTRTFQITYAVVMYFLEGEKRKGAFKKESMQPPVTWNSNGELETVLKQFKKDLTTSWKNKQPNKHKEQTNLPKT